jgi:hypothetical protein
VKLLHGYTHAYRYWAAVDKEQLGIPSGRLRQSNVVSLSYRLHGRSLTRRQPLDLEEGLWEGF